MSRKMSPPDCDPLSSSDIFKALQPRPYQIVLSACTSHESRFRTPGLLDNVEMGLNMPTPSIDLFGGFDCDL
jgi:hypothetical protein